MQINVINVNKNVNVQNNGQQGGNNNVTVETNVTAANVQDILEISGQQPQQAASANRYRPDFARMREIRADHQNSIDSFRRLVEGLLSQQAGAAGTPWINNDPSRPNSNLIDIDDATRAAAQEAVGEGGAFSVEAVATRLLDFAVAISGGDPSRIDVLRRAVERGFEAAERQWGGTLPDISQQTREAVMQGFDQWQQAGNANAITLLNRGNTPPATPVAPGPEPINPPATPVAPGPEPINPPIGVVTLPGQI